MVDFEIVCFKNYLPALINAPYKIFMQVQLRLQAIQVNGVMCLRRQVAKKQEKFKLLPFLSSRRKLFREIFFEIIHSNSHVFIQNFCSQAQKSDECHQKF